MTSKIIKLSKQVIPFTIEGRLLTTTLKPDLQVKILHLHTANGEIDIHVTRSLRDRLRSASWRSGMNLIVTGRKIHHRLTGRVKFKAETLRSADQVEFVAAAPMSSSTILICRKCQEKSVCKALAAELADRDLGGHVKVEFTGCIKRCDSAPNLVVITTQSDQPKSRRTKTHYGNLKRKQIPALLDRHGLSKHPVQASSPGI
jgi:(2Fe-2S) ferredoxin